MFIKEKETTVKILTARDMMLVGLRLNPDYLHVE